MAVMVVHTFVFVPQIIAVLWVLLPASAADNCAWNDEPVAPDDGDDSCSDPGSVGLLRRWCIFFVVSSAVHLVTGWLVLLRREGRIAEGTRLARASQFAEERLQRPVDVLRMAWFVAGNIWITAATSGSCAKAACPALMRLSWTVLILQYVGLCLPCVLLILLLPVACFCLPCLIRALRALSLSNADGGAGSRGASQEEIQSLPEEVYDPDQVTSSVDDRACSICLGEYERGDVLRRLPCAGMHRFHKACIDPWLEVNASCPNCRTHVCKPTADTDVERATTAGEAAAPAAAAAREVVMGSREAGSTAGAGAVESGAIASPALEEQRAARPLRRGAGRVPASEHAVDAASVAV
jgi:hypothetical protein